MIAHDCRWRRGQHLWAGSGARHATTKTPATADAAHQVLLHSNSLRIEGQHMRIYTRVGFIGKMVNRAMMGNGQLNRSEP